MVGPLTAGAPIFVDTGAPFGKLAINGVLSGFGLTQSNAAPADNTAHADLSNGQMFLQKPTGLVQFYLQAGAYNLPALGTPYLSTRNTISDYYGPLPVAYLKLAPTPSVAVLAGKLTTLIGAEDTFTFENMNTERGLLWAQENAVNRGVQISYTQKKLAASLSWNDGFYSNRFNWLTASVAWTFNAANSLSATAGRNFGHTGYSTTAAPALQNNSGIYDLIYTHTGKKLLLEPYFQFTRVPYFPAIGVTRATSTQGEAILGSYTLPQHMSLAGRLEFISSTGNATEGSANLLYGAGSNATSFTVTPTYQNKSFFARGDVSWVHTGSYTAGDAFGAHGNNSSQVRGVIETGFLF